MWTYDDGLEVNGKSDRARILNGYIAIAVGKDPLKFDFLEIGPLVRWEGTGARVITSIEYLKKMNGVSGRWIKVLGSACLAAANGSRAYSSRSY